MTVLEIPQRDKELVDVSVVVPIWNEKATLKKLTENIDTVLLSLDLRYEIIYVDDGSTDGTTTLLEELCSEYKNLRVIFLTKNFGQHAAMLAGFKYVNGKVVITMDADLQNDPKDIPKFLEEINKGFELVSGYRKERKVGITRKIPSLIVNYIFKKMTGVTVKDYGCNFKAFTRELVTSSFNSGDMQRYAVFFLIWKGCAFSEIEISDDRRQSGSSKYSFFKLATLLLDIFITFSSQPYMLLMLMLAGIMQCVGGISIFGILIINGIITQAKLNTNLLILSVLLICVGIQIVTMAIFNERITRINQRVQKRPLFYVRRILKHSQKKNAAAN